MRPSRIRSIRHAAALALTPALFLTACGSGDAPAPAPRPADATPLSTPSPSAELSDGAASTSAVAAPTSAQDSRPGESSDAGSSTNRVEVSATVDAGGFYEVEEVGKDFFQWRDGLSANQFFEPLWTTYVDGQALTGENCSSTMQLFDASGQVFEQFKTRECSHTKYKISNSFEKLNKEAPGLNRGEEASLTMTVEVETPDGEVLKGTYEFTYRYPNR
ncbi:hypothetical protein ACFWGD_09340 [Corynebacterium sp. NPDC060344]|uniref:hypothetical protein n=1 Tax=Corynebacterium sp. NPDC060344 TaxID=3347101 RepID=UPI003649670D